MQRIASLERIILDTSVLGFTDGGTILQRKRVDIDQYNVQGGVAIRYEEWPERAVV